MTKMRVVRFNAIVVAGGHFAGLLLIRSKKLLHVMMRRRVLRMAGGVCIIAASAIMLHHRPEYCNEMAWESIAYLIHGIGSIPFLKPLEPLFGAVEEVA